MIDITIKLEYKGWVNVNIFNGENDLNIFASRLSDCLSHFIVTMSKITNGECDEYFSLQEEPGQYRFLFTRTEEKLDMKVLWFEDTFSNLNNEKGKEIFKGSDDLLKFSRKVIRLFDKLKYDYGIDGYKNNWTYSFPDKELDLLKLSFRKLKDMKRG